VISASALAQQPRQGDYPGFAAAFRRTWGLTPDLIRASNMIDLVGITETGGFRVRRTLRWTGSFEPGETMEAWPVDVLPDGEGGWVVDPIRPFSGKELGQVRFGQQQE
jgi:hypothetical protein